MGRTYKIIAVVITIIGLFYLGTYAYLGHVVKTKLNKLPQHVNISYSSCQLHALKGSITFNDLDLRILTRKSKEITFKLATEQLDISGLSYFKLFNEEFNIEKVALSAPRLIFRKKESDSTKQQQSLNLKALFKIKTLFIRDGEVSVYKGNEQLLQVSQLNSHIEYIIIDNNTLKNNIPILYDSYSFNGQDLKAKLNSFENLYVSKFSIDDSQVSANNIKVKTRLNRKEFDS